MQYGNERAHHRRLDVYGNAAEKYEAAQNG